ncbi:unnamed protein product [Linum tenue]|uniref:Uncharacterized protein n=1 Tax=Linum tenue TaxID=586396 RepID=A0AAV0HUB9_9ROSI|nr:unnamed protein product [Linum tenue]
MSLRVLDFSANHLMGELPQCLSNLTSLQKIDVHGNQFRIPISLFPFFNHSRLQSFWGGNNQEIYGDDHLDQVQLRKVELYSRLGYGGYVGPFPKFLYHQANLGFISISNVNITGVVAGFPWWLVTNNTHLEFLYLHNCSLSRHFQFPIHQQLQRGIRYPTNDFFPSPIPPDICAFFPNIDFLSLSDNEFYGKIPLQLSNCSSFRLLDASNNLLRGEIPRWIWNMSVGSILDLSRNKFSGHLPPGFISPLMDEVYLSRNQLEGNLPATLSDNYSIGVLDLSHNHLMGTIPKWIGGLRQLSYILLNDNQFHGGLPGTFCLETSKLIDVSHNHLSGYIGSEILTSNDTNCNVHNAHYRPKHELEFVTKTKLYTYKGMPLFLMSGLDLSSNNFTGEIPPQIGNLGDIKVLNLSYNMFTGHIPTTIANLSQIESLDLSHNDLSGVIPSQLMELHYLSTFSVAYNNLSGKCLQKIAQFSTFDENIYRGNPLLNCTLPLMTPNPLVRPTTYDGDEEGEGGFIDMESFYVSGSISYVMVLLVIASVLHINPYWRRIWFYCVGVTITTCYYFVVDHLPVPTRYKVWEPRV